MKTRELAMEILSHMVDLVELMNGDESETEWAYPKLDKMMDEVRKGKARIEVAKGRDLLHICKDGSTTTFPNFPHGQTVFCDECETFYQEEDVDNMDVSDWYQ